MILKPETNSTEIIDSKGFNYLSNFMIDLPDDIILNKITTGSGMTSLALTTKRKYVICVPFTSLISNKLIWCEKKGIKAIGIFDKTKGGSTEEDLTKFKGDKIFVTWDSLPKVVNFLGDDILNWKILIDESHKLVDSGAFRENAIENVLDNYTKFGNFIFGTATPVKDKYQLPELKDIKKVQIKWYDLEPVTVNYTKYLKDIHKVGAVICIDFLTGKQKGNAHIFINSVKSIAKIVKIIKEAGYNVPDDIKIVCANQDRNAAVIKDSLGSKFKIESVDNPVKKINFYTSTCFEGCDILDKDGRSFIISDGSKDYSKIDIITTLPQIIGRNRNAKNKNIVELLYTPNRFYSNTTEEEFEVWVKQQIKDAEDACNAYANNPIMIREAVIQNCETNNFLKLKNGIPTVNSTSWYNEMNSFSTLHNIYYVSRKDRDVKDEDVVLSINSIDYSYKADEQIEITGLNKASLGKKTNFSDLCILYISIKEELTFENASIMQIDAIQPIISEAYNKLGAEKMKALKYRKIDIERELLLSSTSKTNEYKVVKMLEYRVGQWIPLTEIKGAIKGVYNILHIAKVAKATDLNDYYVTKAQSKFIDGKTVKGLTIILNKIK